MSRHVFKMPDLGEGTVEAEIVAWNVKPGELVREDQILLEVMTEKATVEIPSPVTGRVISVAGVAGQSMSVGAELILFETAEADAAISPSTEQAASAGDDRRAIAAADETLVRPADSVDRRVMASPATRRRARQAGIELTQVTGSGPGGRIRGEDLDAFLARPPGVPAAHPRPDVEEIPVIGLRRLIAERMTEAVRTIPHFSYVEEVDVSELEALRRHLNAQCEPSTPPLTYLPFIALALARVVHEHPQCNAHYLADRNVVARHGSLHLGIATQTKDGLKVPVVRHVNGRSLANVAAEIRRVTEAARDGTAKREELTGSTLTVTSLGKVGGIATTPIINAPEVAIIGVNRAVERPVVRDGAIVIRRMMNLSSSFDHRFVDGQDAASMIQALKDCLEHPATIFLDQGALA
jgi:2-oxoisovalerate dehydrogenase E2 component (dihydrolipoyl transacylase)